MPLRIGIIGLGAMGCHHARDLASFELCEVVAGADTSDEAREAFRNDAPNAARYCAVADIPRDALDAVIIATPHMTHTALAEDALERKWHVLIEKPFSLNVAKARHVVQIARHHMRLLALAYSRRVEPAWLQFVTPVLNGGIEPATITWRCLHDQRGIYGGATWRTRIAESGGGILCDTGSHLTDAILSTFGPASSVVSSAQFDKNGIERTIAGTCLLRGGVAGVFSYSCEEEEGEWALIISRNVNTLQYCDGSTSSTGWPLPTYSVPESPARNFVRAIVEGAQLIAPAHTVLATVAFTEAAYRSAWNKA